MKLLSVLFIFFTITTNAQKINYFVTSHLVLVKNKVNYSPNSADFYEPFIIEQGLAASWETLIGINYRYRYKFGLALGMQQYQIGYYAFTEAKSTASAGVSGGSANPIGFLLTTGIYNSVKLAQWHKLSLHMDLQMLIGSPKFENDINDTSTNAYFWLKPNDFKTWRITYPPFVSYQLLKLIKPGITITYNHNKRIDFNIGISKQFNNQVFYRDTSNIIIPTLQKQQIYTAEVTGNAMLYHFGLTYKFLSKE